MARKKPLQKSDPVGTLNSQLNRDFNKVIKEKDYQKKDKLKIGGVDEDLEVRCGKDFLKIKILQRNGKKPISAVDFLNGNKISISEFC